MSVCCRILVTALSAFLALGTSVVLVALLLVGLFDTASRNRVG